MRPTTPKTLDALKDYQVKDRKGWKWTVVQIAQRYGMHHSHLCRAARKHGLRRYKR